MSPCCVLVTPVTTPWIEQHKTLPGQLMPSKLQMDLWRWKTRIPSLLVCQSLSAGHGRTARVFTSSPVPTSCTVWYVTSTDPIATVFTLSREREVEKANRSLFLACASSNRQASLQQEWIKLALWLHHGVPQPLAWYRHVQCRQWTAIYGPATIYTYWHTEPAAWCQLQQNLSGLGQVAGVGAWALCLLATCKHLWQIVSRRGTIQVLPWRKQALGAEDGSKWHWVLGTENSNKYQGRIQC